MPLWHCNKCHHEWEGTEDHNVCDWCKDDGHIIEKVTPFERFCTWLLGERDAPRHRHPWSDHFRRMPRPLANLCAGAVVPIFEEEPKMTIPLIRMLKDACEAMSLQLAPTTMLVLVDIATKEGVSDADKVSETAGALEAMKYAGIVIGIVAARDYVKVMQHRNEPIRIEDLADLVRAIAPGGNDKILHPPVKIEDMLTRLKHYERQH